jgi:translation initiation factor IF-1
MTRNKRGGNKYKKQKKTNDSKNIIKRYELKDNESFAKVVKIFGGKLVELELINCNTKVIGVLNNTMYKKVWLERNDYVVITQSEKYYDILFKFCETIDFKVDNTENDIEFKLNTAEQDEEIDIEKI